MGSQLITGCLDFLVYEAPLARFIGKRYPKNTYSFIDCRALFLSSVLFLSLSFSWFSLSSSCPSSSCTSLFASLSFLFTASSSFIYRFFCSSLSSYLVSSSRIWLSNLSCCSSFRSMSWCRCSKLFNRSNLAKIQKLVRIYSLKFRAQRMFLPENTLKV